MRILVNGLIVAALLVGLGACDHKPSGKYTATGGIASIEFKSGKAILTSDIGGHQSETDDYAIDGSTITVKGTSGDIKFTIMKDGSLEGMLGTFKKAAD